MSTPPTAGFDPIFPIHHANIDRLWAKWSCMPGKTWGKLPPRSWFEEKVWYFFDSDGKEVNLPRRAYFDYRAMGVRFYDEDPKCTPLELPPMTDRAFTAQASVDHKSLVRSFQRVHRAATALTIPAVPRAAVSIPLGAQQGLRSALTRLKGLAAAEETVESRIFMRLEDVRLGGVAGTGFDVYVTSHPDAAFTRRSSSFVGSISLFRHVGGTVEHHEGHTVAEGTDSSTETFDVSKVLQLVDPERMDRVHVVFVPYSLLESADPKTNTLLVNRETMTVGAIDFAQLQ